MYIMYLFFVYISVINIFFSFCRSSEVGNLKESSKHVITSDLRSHTKVKFRLSTFPIKFSEFLKSLFPKAINVTSNINDTKKRGLYLHTNLNYIEKNTSLPMEDIIMNDKLYFYESKRIPKRDVDEHKLMLIYKHHNITKPMIFYEANKTFMEAYTDLLQKPSQGIFHVDAQQKLEKASLFKFPEKETVKPRKSKIQNNLLERNKSLTNRGKRVYMGDKFNSYKKFVNPSDIKRNVSKLNRKEKLINLRNANFPVEYTFGIKTRKNLYSKRNKNKGYEKSRHRIYEHKEEEHWHEKSWYGENEEDSDDNNYKNNKNIENNAKESNIHLKNYHNKYTNAIQNF